MKILSNISFLILVFIISFNVFGHEGHDTSLGEVVAPHGGQLKITSQLYVELVSSSVGFKLYVMDHDFKTIPINEINIEGTSRFPKKQKMEKLKFRLSENYWESTIDPKGFHRYTVDLKLGYRGKNQIISFIVEP